MRPTIELAPDIDAYLWVKPPGESDGATDETDPHFDKTCVDANATPDAPQAGEWFHEYLRGLIDNADPPLT